MTHPVQTDVNDCGKRGVSVKPEFKQTYKHQSKELRSNNAYVDGKVEQPGHPLHGDSGVILGHYSDVLSERRGT